MKRLFLSLLILVGATTLHAQVPLLVESFKKVPLEEGKVVFKRELQLKDDDDTIFQALRVWARDSYGKDPFISSVRYDQSGRSITAKSRVELLLPEDSKNVREKVVMRYRVDAVVYGKKCTVIFRDISYLYENPLKNNILPKLSKAEDLIADQVQQSNDGRDEFRDNLRKSTLFFVNQTLHELYGQLLSNK